MVWSAKSTGTEELVECIRSKPLKRRGLSKFYRSKSQSFSSLELVLSSRHGDSAAALGKAAWHCCGSGSLGGAAVAGRRSPSPLVGCSEDDDDDRQSLNSNVVVRRRRLPCGRRHVGASRSYERASTTSSLDMEDDQELSSPAAAALHHHQTSPMCLPSSQQQEQQRQQYFCLPLHASSAPAAAVAAAVAVAHQHHQLHHPVGSSCSLPSQSALAASCSSSTSCGGVAYSPCTCTCTTSSCSSSSSGLLLGAPSSPHLGAHCHLHLQPLPGRTLGCCAANATNAFARSISSDMYGSSGGAPTAALSGSLEHDSCSLGSSFTAAGGAWSCPGAAHHQNQTQSQLAAHAQHPASSPAPPRHWAGQAADALCAALQMASLGPLQRQQEERRGGAAARARISSST